MALGEGYTVDEVMEMLPPGLPFKDVTKEDVKELLCMLAAIMSISVTFPCGPDSFMTAYMKGVAATPTAACWRFPPEAPYRIRHVLRKERKPG
jgi:hypothetical protein